MRYYLLEWLLFKKTHKSQQVLARMWRNWNHCTMLVGMQDIVATVQNCWRFLKKLKVELHVIQQFHSWVFTQRK